MSASKELWGVIYNRLKADTALMAMVGGIYDKAPSDPWKGKEAYISRGPFSGIPDDADCIYGQELTVQIDVWSRASNRWSVDDILGLIKASLHDEDLNLPQSALVTLQAQLWRVMDDPDPTQQHGIIQFTALIEEPA